MIQRIKYILIVILFIASTGFSQSGDKVYVDSEGILRWTEDESDVSLFGVNYSVPFAHAYRSIEKLGLSHKSAIDVDVNQFARLELDAYRIHIWDREISDKEGSIDNNKHLELLDYLIYKLKEKNISIILTPIAWWGTGWPEPDPQTKGFSTYYSKEELVTDLDARKAQKNYIKQILNHKNKYTSLSYKNDPDIIAYEIINEPGHPGNIDIVTEYINELSEVFRQEGVTKPLYYNISQNWSDEQAKAVYRSNIDGISFQWYPTGLVKYSALKGNYLPHVDHYTIPGIDDPEFKNKTRMVYEFDAADIAGPIMYPAMARSFREAGMQWATMFAYDATYLASFNTEYNTHYVNLLYTPGKAISLMIAANVFREVDVYQKFQSYPGNTEFDGFRISYDDNLSEYVGENKFYYSNNTDTYPGNIPGLEHIAGCGSSPLIKYNGSGAYFLDKLSDGIWRAEIYPDVVEIKDPFGRNSLDRKVRDLLYTASELTIELDELGDSYIVYPVNNIERSELAESGKVSVKPGVYILSKNQLDAPTEIEFNYRGLKINDYTRIETEPDVQYIIDATVSRVIEGKLPRFNLEIYSTENVDSVKVFAKRLGWRRFSSSKMERTGKYTYDATLNHFDFSAGQVEYCYRVYRGESALTYPGNVTQSPDDWDFEHSNLYKLQILHRNAGFVVFDPEKNNEDILLPPIWGTASLSYDLFENSDNNYVLDFKLSDFKRYIENFTFQIDAGLVLKEFNMDTYDSYEIELDFIEGVDSVYFSVIDFNGSCEGSWIKNINDTKVKIPFDRLDDSNFILLPRPYPHFLPLYYPGTKKNKNEDFTNISYFQFKIPVNEIDELENLSVHFQLGRIKLTK